MATRVCVDVEATELMILSVSRRFVNVETLVGKSAAVASVAADPPVPASGGVGAGVPSSSSFRCPLVFHGSV